MQSYVSPLSSPLTVGRGKVPSDQKEAANVVERTNVQTGTSPQSQRQSPHDESYSATFESNSHMENDVVQTDGGRVDTGILNLL